MMFRAVWWFKGVRTKPRSPIDDHSIDAYCKKLKTYALTRLNIYLKLSAPNIVFSNYVRYGITVSSLRFP